MEEDKKRSVFPSIVGANTYKLLRNLLTPAKPGDMSYKELVEVLAQHYSPTPAESVQQYKFHSWVRKPGESVATFVLKLRSLAEFCNFGGALEDMLRYGIVCGIKIDSKATPRFCKAHPIPYAFKAKVEEELDALLGKVLWSQYNLPIGLHLLNQS